MINIEQLSELYDRVAKLTEPDYETSVSVLMALFQDYDRDCAEETASVQHEDPLRSIDAVEALRKRLLPFSSMVVYCGLNRITSAFYEGGSKWENTAPTEPMSRLLSLMKALIEIGKKQ